MFIWCQQYNNGSIEITCENIGPGNIELATHPNPILNFLTKTLNLPPNSGGLQFSQYETLYPSTVRGR